MPDQNQITRIYFIGIGGIGMSAIARYFNEKGTVVNGYDKTPTELTRIMEKEGIGIHYEDNIELLDKLAHVVVYTPAIPPDHREFTFFKENNYRLLKRSEILQIITEGTFNICVAGTHGKTTISTMIAHILRDSNYGCNAFLGGISSNYNTNFWSHTKKVNVVEADEYDRSFLRLSPDVAVISSMDPDHLEIYGDETGMQQGFIDFTKRIKPGGVLISKYGLKRSNDLKAPNHIRYSLQNNEADVYATNITMLNGSYCFDVMQSDWKVEKIVLHMGGMHNVENAVAAITAAHHLDIENDSIRRAMADFKGVKRRFEYIIPPLSDEPVFIDDYAHHPQELKALINGAKNLFGDKKCTIIFQPHLFSRTRDLASEFAAALDFADEVILLPIYPARELPVPGITSEVILEKMKLKKKHVFTREELLSWVGSQQKPEVLITAGAGDIDKLIVPIREMLQGMK
jgi:UDP-N-acetylmuramate--alanine ligase